MRSRFEHDARRHRPEARRRLRQAQRAGFEDKDKIEIEGGGLFGVVVESNWTVCEQQPATGQAVSGEPKLIVDRSCGSNTDPTDEPSVAASQSPSKEASPTATATPEPAILRAGNNHEFATILGLGDNCSHKIATFAKKHVGSVVRFDGTIWAMAPHGTYKTRFDFLVGPGDFNPDSASGPSFQIRDKNVFDLNLTGKQIPAYVRPGQNYTFTAELGDYDQNACLYQLEPVETKVR